MFEQDKWTIPHLVDYREILALFAYYSIKQLGICLDDETGDVSDSNLPHPPYMDKVIGYLFGSIRHKFDEYGFASLSANEIHAMLLEALKQNEVFQRWGDTTCLKGSRMDLDILIYNVCSKILETQEQIESQTMRLLENIKDRLE